MQKKYSILLLVILCTSTKLSAQWQVNGSAIYNTNSGHVGIGTSSPSSNLAINGTGTVETQIITDNTPSSRPIISFARSANFWNLGMNINQGNNDDFHFRYNTNYFLTIKSNGYVGIGNPNPVNKLDIAGSCRINYANPSVNLLQVDDNINYGLVIRPDLKVGIGTNLPINKLDVVSSLGTDRISIKSTNKSANIGYMISNPDNSERWSIASKYDLDFLQIYRAGYGNVMVFKDDGNIGIGANSPNSKLTIENGTLNLNTTSNFGGDYPTLNSNYSNVLAIGGIGAESGLKIYKQNSGNSPTFLGGANYIDAYVFEMTDDNEVNPDGGILFGATGNDNVFDKIMTIRGNGNVGIGTVNPKNLLDVNGTIHAREVKVDVNDWSDFVFQPTYKLRPLIEVEKYIKANGHLEDIPSAKEVEKNGVNMGEMQAKLLQKIEELTLYVIEKDKELKEQALSNTELKKQLAAQSKEIILLKDLITQQKK
jgi:hypothetical protein